MKRVLFSSAFELAIYPKCGSVAEVFEVSHGRWVLLTRCGRPHRDPNMWIGQ